MTSRNEMTEAIGVPVTIPSTPTRQGDVSLIRSPTVVSARSVSRRYKRLLAAARAVLAFAPFTAMTSRSSLATIGAACYLDYSGGFLHFSPPAGPIPTSVSSAPKLETSIECIHVNSVKITCILFLVTTMPRLDFGVACPHEPLLVLHIYLYQHEQSLDYMYNDFWCIMVKI